MDTPTVNVRQDFDGSTVVEVNVQGYESVLNLSIGVEYSDGAWVVSIPWPRGLDDRPMLLPDGHEVLNGLIYVGTPEDDDEE